MYYNYYYYTFTEQTWKGSLAVETPILKGI